MRYSLFALLLLLATACTRETQTTIRFNVQDPDDTPPRVIVGWNNDKVSIDPTTGEGVKTMDLQAPTYALIEVRKHDRRLCFLEPGKDLTLAYSQKKGEKQVTYGGVLARNRIHQSRKLCHDSNQLQRHGCQKGRPKSGLRIGAEPTEGGNDPLLENLQRVGSQTAEGGNFCSPATVPSVFTDAGLQCHGT